MIGSTLGHWGFSVALVVWAYDTGGPYVIADGDVDVSVDGSHVRRQARGESFGEIALLRDTPRTATITASEPTTLIAIDREPFLSAVTGHAGSAEAAEGMVAAWLAHTRPALATV